VNTWADSPAATMNDHLTELAGRRARLQEKSAAQRRELGAHMSATEARFSGVDRGLVKVSSWLRKPPLLLAGGAALLVGVGPRRALHLAGKAVLLITTARRLLRLAR